MKIKLFTFICIVLMVFQVNAQNGAAINTTGSPADPSAMLDVSSTNSGVLIPRMTETQKNAIPSPATGLMVYQTDGSTGFWYYNGAIWMQSLGLTGATGPTGPTGLLPAGSSVGNTPYWDGTQWVVNSSNIYNNGGSVGINTSSPDASAYLDISGTSKGFLVPRMSSAERNAISNPAAGLQIFNTTTECLEIYISPVWQSVYCGCDPPAGPAASSHTPSETGIIWSWNVVSGANGYKYNTVNNYSTAVDNGSSTSYTQTGLSCNTSYTLYVWSYGDCGESATPSALTQTTSACFVCGVNTVTFTYRGSSVTYETASGQNGACWLNKNLGAAQVATAYNDANAYGDLFQWGRLDDGHQDRASAITTTLSTTDVPGHSNFIKVSSGDYDWRTPQNNNLWQGLTGANNPCPSGWRIPTETEFNTERASWAQQNYNGAMASPLKIPVGGSRSMNGVNFYDVGVACYCWSSTYSSGIGANFLYVSGSGTDIMGSVRGAGNSVRCIKD